jgi:hypothetical protein
MAQRQSPQQDRPQQVRQQIARKGRPASQPAPGQKGKRPVPGSYKGALECESSPATNPRRAR